MAKKYDTNPLDGEVLRRAEENRGRSPEPAVATQDNHEANTKFFEAQTRRFTAVPTAEMPTQQLGDVNFEEPYQSVFHKPQQFSSAVVNNSVSSAAQKLIVPPTSRAVVGVGLPEKLVMLLPYLPMTVGAIAAVFILLFASRTETRVRFHAAQGLALHLASWLLGTILAVTSEIMPFGSLPTRLFTAAYIIFFIVCLVRVWQGKSNHIESLDDITDFLNEKIKPRK